MHSIFDLDTGRVAATRYGPGSDSVRMPGSTGGNGAGGAAAAAVFSRVVDADAGVPLDLTDGDSVVVVLGEQADELVAGPGRLLQTAAELRDRGHRIALAGVGDTPASLAILPLLRPDLLEVDLRTLEKQPDWQRAQTINAITAYAEELPSLVLAVGVECEADLLLARSIGATLGQGEAAANGSSLPIRPDGTGSDGAGPERTGPERTGSELSGSSPSGIVFGAPLRPAVTADEPTPFSVTAADHPVRTASRAQLKKTSQFLETCAFDCDEATVVLSTFQKSSNLTPDVVELYSALSRNLSYVFALTHSTESNRTTPSDVPHLRVRTFEPEHPLSQEWNVIIVNARYQAMLVARETIDRRSDEQLFEYVLTHNRETVLQAAQALVPLL